MFLYNPIIHKIPEIKKETYIELQLEIESVPLIEKEQDRQEKVIKIEIL